MGPDTNKLSDGNRDTSNGRADEYVTVRNKQNVPNCINYISDHYHFEPGQTRSDIPAKALIGTSARFYGKWLVEVKAEEKPVVGNAPKEKPMTTDSVPDKKKDKNKTEKNSQ